MSLQLSLLNYTNDNRNSNDGTITKGAPVCQVLF